MKIRLYNKKDLYQLKKLLEEFLKYTQKSYSNETRKFSRTIKNKEKLYVNSYVKKFTQLKRSRFFVVEDEGKLVAYILGSIQTNNFEKDKLRGHIESVFVSKDFRNKKLGKELYLKLIEWFKKQGCTQLILEVAEGNPAIKVYKKWGFKTTRREMKKKL